MATDEIEVRLQRARDDMSKQLDRTADLRAQVRTLRQRVAEVEQERDGLREYLALCLDNTAGSQFLAWNHGMRDSEEVIELGKKLRKRLGLPEDVKGQVEALRTHEPSDDD